VGGLVSGWLRRNRGALIAAGTLALLTTIVVGGNEWWRIAQNQEIVPISAAAEQSIEFGGVRYGPASASELVDAADAGAPEGTRVVIVEVPVDPGDIAARCPVRTALHELGGAGRTWTSSPSDVDWYPDGPSLCGTDEPGPFVGTAWFLVPDDAAGPFGLELSLADQLPRYLRLAVDIP
jgi:hypothetical protein